MTTNLSPYPIRLTIGDVDYSSKLTDSWSFRYDKLRAGVAGGVLPFSGQIVLGCDDEALPINNRLNPELFTITTPVVFELDVGGAWYPLPPMEAWQANYNSVDNSTTLVMGDRFFLAKQIPQDVNSRALDIRVGGVRDGITVMARLLGSIGVQGLTFEAEDSILRFRHPHNFGTNYVEALDQIASSEGWVIFTAPDGNVVARETWTVAAEALVNTPDYSEPLFPLPVLGKYRFGPRECYEDQAALDRCIEEFTEIAMPSLVANRYSSEAAYYEIYETETPQVSRSPDGLQKTTKNFDFSGATVEQITRIREQGSEVYAGIAGAPSGEVETEVRTEFEEYDQGEPGRLQRQVITEEIRVAKVARSLRGWYSQNGEIDVDVDGNGDMVGIPFPGQLWTSMITAKRTVKQTFYETARNTVITSQREVTEQAAITIFDGLTNGVPWDLIIEASPVALGSLTFARQVETQWVEEEKGRWAILRFEKTVHALADTGDRSSIIGGLQRAADEGDTQLAAYWLIRALRPVTIVSQRVPASEDNIPPAFTPKPRRWRGERRQINKEVRFAWPTGVPQDIPKSVSIPFVSDNLNANQGDLRAENNLRIVLQQIARRDRMEQFSYELTSPIYPEILAGFSPYSAMDVYQAASDSWFRVITSGLSITGDADEAAIHCIAPTLARIDGTNFIHPWEEVT